MPAPSSVGRYGNEACQGIRKDDMRPHESAATPQWIPHKKPGLALTFPECGWPEHAQSQKNSQFSKSAETQNALQNVGHVKKTASQIEAAPLSEFSVNAAKHTVKRW